MHFFFLFALASHVNLLLLIIFHSKIPSFAGRRDLYVLEIKLKYKFGFKEHHLFWELCD